MKQKKVDSSKASIDDYNTMRGVATPKRRRLNSQEYCSSAKKLADVPSAVYQEDFIEPPISMPCVQSDRRL